MLGRATTHTAALRYLDMPYASAGMTSTEKEWNIVKLLRTFRVYTAKDIGLYGRVDRHKLKKQSYKSMTKQVSSKR